MKSLPLVKHQLGQQLYLFCLGTGAYIQCSMFYAQGFRVWYKPYETNPQRRLAVWIINHVCSEVNKSTTMAEIFLRID